MSNVAIFQNSLNHKARINRFLIRVYSSDNNALNLQRRRVADILSQAYGENFEDEINHLLDKIFGSRMQLYSEELNLDEIDIEILVTWVEFIFSTFLKPPSEIISKIEKRYSIPYAIKVLKDRYKVSEDTEGRLRQMFSAISALSSSAPTATRHELSQDKWINETKNHIHPALAEILFLSKLNVTRSTWRFLDFFQFCLEFGCADREDRARNLVDIFFKVSSMRAVPVDSHSTGDSTISHKIRRIAIVRYMLYILSMDHYTCERKLPIEGHGIKSNITASLTGSDIANGNTRLANNADTMELSAIESVTENFQLSQPYSHSTDMVYNSYQDYPLPAFIEDALRPFGTKGGGAYDGDTTRSNSNNNRSVLGPGPDEVTKEEAVRVLLSLLDSLPAVAELRVLACCKFGVRPPSPRDECELITLVSAARAGSGAGHPMYGPVGTEWCIISNSWLQQWRLYVGQEKRVRAIRRADRSSL